MILACSSWLVIIATLSAAAVLRLVRSDAAFATSNASRNGSLLLSAILAFGVLVPTLVVRALRPPRAIEVLGVASLAAALAMAVGARSTVDLALVGALELALYQWGRWLLQRLYVGEGLESIVLCLAMGNGALGLYVLLLGSCKMIHASTVLAPLVPAWLWWLRSIARSWPTRPQWSPRALPWWETTLAGLTAFHLLMGLAMALAPEVMSDAIHQHLALARAFAESHSLGVVPSVLNADWPLEAEALFSAGFVVHGPVLAKLLHTAAGVAGIVTVGLIARRLAGARAGLIAAALIGSMPIVVWELGTAYVDGFALWYVASAALCFLAWRAEGQRQWMILAGLLLGFGLGCKLTVAFGALGLGGALLVTTRREAPRRLRAGAFALCGIASSFAPWLLRSIHLKGEVPGWSLFLSAAALRADAPLVAPRLSGDLPGFGFGRDLLALARLPWDLTFATHQFGPVDDGFVGFTMLALLPLVLVMRRRPAQAALCCAFLVMFGSWFWTAQYVRYGVPALGLLCALLGVAVVDLRERMSTARRRLAMALLGPVTCALTLTSAIPYLATITNEAAGLPFDLILGRETKEQHLLRALRGYATIRDLDRVAPPGTPVAFVSDGYQLYTHVKPLGYNGTGFSLSDSERAMQEQLDANGVAFVVVDRRHIAQMVPLWREAYYPVLDRILERAQVISAHDRVYLYRLGHGPTVLGPELLDNGDFEASIAGVPTHWAPIGSPRYDTQGGYARSGRGAVRGAGSSGYFQLVKVAPQTPYLLSFFARCDDHAPRLQINWMDPHGRHVESDIETPTTGPRYERKYMWARAPARAELAEVYVASSDPESGCWFDDYSFRSVLQDPAAP
jgi:hypothetical protein